MKICVITYKYPGKHNSSEYAFVKQLVDAFAALGNECAVIAPFNISHYKSFSKKKEVYSCGEECVTVLRPNYLSLARFHLGNFSFTRWLRKRAINKAFKMLPFKPDVVYSHFWNSGYVGFKFAKQLGVPLFVATGESDVGKMFSFPSDLAEFKDYVSGVICVSSKNRDESVNLGLTKQEKCIVLPNAVKANLFRKLDKQACRRQLGFPEDAFIVAFVGWFIERKGPLRVAAAIKNVDGINSVFIGKGEQEPDCDGILYKGPLAHNDVPIYLNAADCFVLPTLAEGCCNAVVEAMACGLPVISSNLPFNWDVLDETNSILVDPNNVDEIACAIQTLRNDTHERERLAEGALDKTESLTIEKRAKAILDFIESRTR